MYRQLKKFFLEREIAQYYSYLNSLGQYLASQSELPQTEFDGEQIQSLALDDEFRDDIIGMQVRNAQNADFANRTMQSFLVNLFSFMELWLTRECYLDSSRRDNGSSWQNTRGHGIKRAQKYYSTVLASAYPFASSSEWEWLTKLQLLRNCIVHRNGSLTGFSRLPIDKNLAKFVGEEEGLSLSGVDGAQIFINKEFCEKAIQNVHKFLVELMC